VGFYKASDGNLPNGDILLPDAVCLSVSQRQSMFRLSTEYLPASRQHHVTFWATFSMISCTWSFIRLGSKSSAVLVELHAGNSSNKSSSFWWKPVGLNQWGTTISWCRIATGALGLLLLVCRRLLDFSLFQGFEDTVIFPGIVFLPPFLKMFDVAVIQQHSVN
jgi:hypothetical protein